jgi:hypothetical protein
MPDTIPLAGLLIISLLVLAMAAATWDSAQRRLALVGVIGLAAGLALGFLFALNLVDDEDRAWSRWRQSIDRSVARCAEEADGATCLAEAIEQNPAPADGADASVTERFFDDVRAGEALLETPRARDLLWEEFGIDSEEFIGTGHSVSREGETRSYANARQEEFFVANFCADVVDRNVCPQEVANVWTWRFEAGQIERWLDRPAGEFLAQATPVDHVSDWAAARRTLAEHPSFIRFARFPAQFYAGTVGRADNDLVFFAALPDPSTVTLREIMARTGSSALAEPGEPGETLFVWVYVPEPGAPTPTATWAALFDYLEARAANDN